MKKLFSICAVALLFLSLPHGAFSATDGMFRDDIASRITAPATAPFLLAASGNCAAKARSLASSFPRARILSVTRTAGACDVVIRVKPRNGRPPRIIRRTIPH